MKKLFKAITSFSLLILSHSSVAQAFDESEVKKVRKTPTKTQYIIETQVQGTQEQPNVIYITPWKENDKSVDVEGKILEVNLPKLLPVSPKKFKTLVKEYHQK